MRLPRSVIVMSVVCAVPFGLAIRDTVRHHQSADNDPREPIDRETEAEVGAEVEAEAERASDERAAERKSAENVLDQLHGPRPASLGLLFGGIRPGDTIVAVDAARTRVASALDSEPVRVDFDDNGMVLTSVTVMIDHDDSMDPVRGARSCDVLSTKLTASWGLGHDNVWLDPVNHQRASLSTDNCRLRFDRYNDAIDWIAAVPFELIGAPIKRLTDRLGPAVVLDLGGADAESSAGRPDYGTARWGANGLAGGHDPTAFTAIIKHGKIVGLAADVDGDATAVRDALAAKLHARPVENPMGGLEWKRVPKVVLDTLDRNVSLQIGDTNWE